MTRRDVFALTPAAAIGAACRGGTAKRIAVIPKATSHLFWVSVQAGALAAGERFHVEILWNGPATEADYSRQVQIIDAMIARRVDGIALAATERQAIVSPVDRAMAAGIPVVVFDSGVDAENYVSFIATDNVEAGRIAAREMGRLLNGSGAVASVMHAPGSYSTMEREQGFREVISKDFPGVKIVAEQFGMSDRGKARAVAENILTAHPELKGFFTSAEPSATGVAQAMQSRNLSGRLKFVTVDSSANLIDEMRQGSLNAIVAQDPFGMAFLAVETLVGKLNGKTPPKKIDLKPKLITRANLDEPAIQQLLNPDVKRYVH